MTFAEFKDQYDRPNNIVLLEGKRDVKEADKEKLVRLGEKLAQETKHITFRSGNADGSDLHFSTGVANINSDRLEVITPYKGHRKSTNKAGTTNSLDDIDLTEKPKVVYQSKSGGTGHTMDVCEMNDVPFIDQRTWFEWITNT